METENNTRIASDGGDDGAKNRSTTALTTELPPWKDRNYSHSYRGWRERIFFETGYFGAKINHNDLTILPFKIFEDSEGSVSPVVSYTDSLKEKNRPRMDHLAKEDLTIEIIEVREDNITHASTIVKHRVVSSNKSPRLWEAGKICQHYEFRALKFDKPGLGAKSNLTFTLWTVVWPDSISLVLDIAKKKEDDGSIASNDYKVLNGGFTVKMKFKDWTEEKYFDSKSHPPSTWENLTTTLTCNICYDATGKNETTDNDIFRHKDGIEIDVSTSPSQQFGTGYRERFNSFLLQKKEGDMCRNFKGGYTDIHDYDDFNVIVHNTLNEEFYVPILLFVQKLANPTGVCPQVCDSDGAPTGIPIQLSKNWHIKNYGRFYCLLPVKANTITTYRIRLVYGFYGSLPAASHANLSLVGYHKHGTRWEQLAIGNWGETYCMDVDLGVCKNAITDLRMLMTKGKDEKKWAWSDAGWGGDWLKLDKADTKHHRCMPYKWKFAYNSHGPCLTDVDYSGYYGDKVVSMQANIKTPRSDDFARTLIHLHYTFNESVPFKNASFFELGTAGSTVTPIVAWGNREGLSEGLHLPQGMKNNQRFIECKIFEGESPWWFGFPKQRIIDKRTWGKGCRGLVIRSYSGFFGGENYSTPTFALVNTRRGDSRPNVTFVLNPPPGVKAFEKGDWVDFQIEVITLPRNADDYYGPNEKFREHLLNFGDTWKKFSREAQGNDLSVNVTCGGKLELNYPITICSDGVSDEINFVVVGGLGAVPIRFNGLHRAKSDLFRIGKDGATKHNVREEQEKHGSDFYQVEFNPKTRLYNHAFNIVLDEYTESSSKWVLVH